MQHIEINLKKAEDMVNHPLEVISQTGGRHNKRVVLQGSTGTYEIVPNRSKRIKEVNGWMILNKFMNIRKLD